MNVGVFACNFQTYSNGKNHQTHDLLLTKYSRLLGHRAMGPGPLIGKTLLYKITIHHLNGTIPRGAKGYGYPKINLS